MKLIKLKSHKRDSPYCAVPIVRWTLFFKPEEA